MTTRFDMNCSLYFLKKNFCVEKFSKQKFSNLAFSQGVFCTMIISVACGGNGLYKQSNTKFEKKIQPENQ